MTILNKIATVSSNIETATRAGEFTTVCKALAARSAGVPPPVAHRSHSATSKNRGHAWLDDIVVVAQRLRDRRARFSCIARGPLLLSMLRFRL